MCVVSIGDSSVSNQNTEGKCVVSIDDRVDLCIVTNDLQV